jgi:hypothetical protein
VRSRPRDGLRSRPRRHRTAAIAWPACAAARVDRINPHASWAAAGRGWFFCICSRPLRAIRPPVWGHVRVPEQGRSIQTSRLHALDKLSYFGGGNMHLIGPSGICRSSRVVHALHDSWISMPLSARQARVEYCRTNAAADLVVAARQVEYIPTHVCEKGGRCGCCCLLRSIWNVGPAEAHSSSMTSRPIGCATSLSSEL